MLGQPSCPVAVGEELGELKTFYLSRCGARQRLSADDVIANSLILGKLTPQIVESVTYSFFRIRDLGLTQIFEVWDDDRGQSFRAGHRVGLTDADDSQFLDERRSEIVSFDIFRMDVFSRRQNDDILSAADDI